jgi:hypothetical protein
VRGGLSTRAEVAPSPHYSRTQPERAALGLVRLQRSGASDWLPRRPGSDARTLRTRPSRLAHHDLRDHLRHAQTSPRDSSDHASDDRPCARLRKARASRPPSRQQQHSPLAGQEPRIAYRAVALAHPGLSSIWARVTAAFQIRRLFAPHSIDATLLILFPISHPFECASRRLFTSLPVQRSKAPTRQPRASDATTPTAAARPSQPTVLSARRPLHRSSSNDAPRLARQDDLDARRRRPDDSPWRQARLLSELGDVCRDGDDDHAAR